MINLSVSKNERAIYVDVSGYISNSEINKFLKRYKEESKSVRSNQFKLIVNVSAFECERTEDLKNVCMTFFKNGYKSIYLVDPQNYIASTIKLGKFEQMMFNKAVKVVPSTSHIN